jgi:hypothetical protein
MTDIAISHQSSVSPLYNWGVLGPVSNTSAVQITAIQLAILLLCAGLLVGLFFWRHRKRMLAIRELADRLGFTYIGQALPRSISLTGTSLQGVMAVWNVIDGERQKIRVIAFDCRIGVGKGSWRRTVIAAQTENDVFGAPNFNRDLTIERSGRWMFLYLPKALAFIPPPLMSAEEIEAHVSAIATETNRFPS